MLKLNNVVLEQTSKESVGLVVNGNAIGLTVVGYSQEKEDAESRELKATVKMIKRLKLRNQAIRNTRCILG